MNAATSGGRLVIATTTAQLLTCSACVSEAEWAQIGAVVAGLAELGHVATVSIQSNAPSLDYEGLLALLREVFGDFVVNALLRAPSESTEPPPAYLMPVWPFDHEIGGLPASTARFLGMDLEVRATPIEDEELGVTLPNHPGSWLIAARPIHAPHFFGKVHTTGH